MMALRREQGQETQLRKAALSIDSVLVSRGATTADIGALIEDLPLEAVLFTADDAVTAGLLRASTKAFGLSLGDRACLALGRRLEAQI